MNAQIKYKAEINRILMEIEGDLFPYLGEEQRHKLLILLHDLVHAAYNYGEDEGREFEYGLNDGE